MVPFPGALREQVSRRTPSRPLACMPSPTASWPRRSLTASGRGADFADVADLNSAPPDPPQAEDPEQLLKEDMARGSGAEFTGDEGLGRYLDLHEHHQRFVSAHKTFGRKVSLGPLGRTHRHHACLMSVRSFRGFFR